MTNEHAVATCDLLKPSAYLRHSVCKDLLVRGCSYPNSMLGMICSITLERDEIQERLHVDTEVFAEHSQERGVWRGRQVRILAVRPSYISFRSRKFVQKTRRIVMLSRCMM